MNTLNATHALTMRPDMWYRDHGGALKETDPAFRYIVSDERGVELAFITNLRPSGFPASWKISISKDRMPGEPTGDYTSAEEALAVLQAEVR